MSDSVSIKLSGLVKTDRQLKDLEKVADSSAVGGVITKLWAAYALQIIGKAFLGSRDPKSGNAWPPLATSTLKGKYLGRVRSSINQGKPLYVTGKMRRSVGPIKMTTNEIEVGTNVPYAKYHNTPRRGGRRRRVPLRRFVAWTPGAPGRLTSIVKMVLKQRGYIQ